ncbi:MAG: DUF2164 domain-containing protein [Anaerosomatales bacterium]|nr:DUF2164 domain-containing protein [Anaerosomatales bacterium]MDT8434151.1 DUF2164 domain-containing protein [Anaerosomatales bacterium]
MKFGSDTEKMLIGSIRRFFLEELEQDIGDLKAMQVLEFCVREVGPSIYNQAIADAQSLLAEKVGDLGGVLYEPEFDYWRAK